MDFHAIETPEALVIFDLSGRCDGVIIALHPTQLAGTATGLATRDPVAPPDQATNGHERTQWTNKAAKSFEKDHAENQPQPRIKHVIPFADEIDGYGGFERFDFYQFYGG